MAPKQQTPVSRRISIVKASDVETTNCMATKQETQVDECPSVASKDNAPCQSRSFAAQSDRFSADSCEWVMIGTNGLFSLVKVKFSMPKCTISETIDRVQNTEELTGGTAMLRVNKELEATRMTGDIKHFIRAYTMESPFYKELNKKLAKRLDPVSSSEFLDIGLAFRRDMRGELTNDWVPSFTTTVLDAFRSPNASFNFFFGRSYGGMRITKEDLSHYRVNALLFQKTFTSTSKDRSVAEGFAVFAAEDYIPTICTYIQDNPLAKSSIDLQDIPVISDEDEVLVLPLTPFKITRIDQSRESGFVEVELAHPSVERVENLDMDDWEPDGITETWTVNYLKEIGFDMFSDDILTNLMDD